MKLENIELSFDNFSGEMSKLKNQKHFDYLVTIIGEDFGEEGYGLANQRSSMCSVVLVKLRPGRCRSLCCHRAGDIVTNCKI